MKNKLLILMFGIILFAGLACATTFQQYETADLLVPCSYNGTNCDATAVCNISIVYPNGTLIVENQLMTNTGNGMPNYTLPNSDVLGDYTYKMSATQAGVSGSYTGEFGITSTGVLSNNKIPIYLLVFSVVLLLLGFLFKSAPIGFFAGILFVMSGMYLMIYGLGDLANLYTQAFALMVMALGIMISISAGFSFIDD